MLAELSSSKLLLLFQEPAATAKVSILPDLSPDLSSVATKKSQDITVSSDHQ